MNKWIIAIILMLASAQYATALENTTCKTCHPTIYQEYQNSMHSRSSVSKDPIHKAVWDKHPAKAKGDYSCAKCHTPSDHQLMTGKSQLIDNPTQRTEPISCQKCHQIESIEKHAKSNKNIYTKKDKHFFSADKEKKGTKIELRKESHFFGLLTTYSGSPHHDIDYSNENYYNGDACMGCHSHKQNSKGFDVCDMDIKQGDSKETCISCHMPEVKGSLANQKGSATHAYHGSNTRINHTQTLSKYIKLSLDKQTSGFDINIKNEATHALFPQPMRLGKLRVTIERGSKIIPLETKSFARVIGTDGKPSMPWLADAVISNNTIKALETRNVHYDTAIEDGDKVTVEFGYYLVNPKVAKKLNITEKSATEFILLSRERFALSGS